MAGGAQGKPGQSPAVKRRPGEGWDLRKMCALDLPYEIPLHWGDARGDGFFYRTVTENRWSMNALPPRSTR